jgi:hypothetical protein
VRKLPKYIKSLPSVTFLRSVVIKLVICPTKLLGRKVHALPKPLLSVGTVQIAVALELLEAPLPAASFMVRGGIRAHRKVSLLLSLSASVLFSPMDLLFDVFATVGGLRLAVVSCLTDLKGMGKYTCVIMASARTVIRDYQSIFEITVAVSNQ